MIEYGVLGPVAVIRDGEHVDLGTPMLRKVLGLLLCQDGRPIAADVMIDAIWDGQPPPTARKTLQVYVMRLRRALGDPGLITHTPAGYAIAIPPDSLDARTFVREARAGSAARSVGDLRAARSRFGTALEL
ncbi:AfsR/SARP family transcriptional regulator [Longispora fulva]|uniref:AfsR/SARP family transcriptional regulator n=1 Tax=Longispora fulva TaxID=619741 RepID=UPI0036D846AF